MRRRGFTLLEVLIALTLMVTAFAIIWGAFTATTQAWRRGSAVIDELHQGDFVMEQVVAALRSAAWYRTVRSNYGFFYEDGDKGYPADRISWVTASSALMPPGSPFAKSLHRITLSVEETRGGKSGLAVRAYPHLATDVVEDEIEPWFVNGKVRGLDCRIWDPEQEDWVDEWTDTNKLPCRVEIALYFDPIEKGQDPVVLRRLVEIPVAAYATQTVTSAEIRDLRSPAGGGGGAGGLRGAGGGAGGRPGNRPDGMPGGRQGAANAFGQGLQGGGGRGLQGGGGRGLQGGGRGMSGGGGQPSLQAPSLGGGRGRVRVNPK